MHKAKIIMFLSIAFFFVALGLAQFLPSGQGQPIELQPAVLSSGDGWIYEANTIYDKDYKDYLLNKHEVIRSIEDLGFSSIVVFQDLTGNGWTINHQFAYEELLGTENKIIDDKIQSTLNPTPNDCNLDNLIPECKKKCEEDDTLPWCSKDK